MKRFVCAVLALALALCACAAFAEWKPEKAVTMIVAYKAGSGTDTTARVLSEYATKLCQFADPLLEHSREVRRLQDGRFRAGLQSR